MMMASRTGKFADVSCLIRVCSGTAGEGALAGSTKVLGADVLGTLSLVALNPGRVDMPEDLDGDEEEPSAFDAAE